MMIGKDKVRKPMVFVVGLLVISGLLLSGCLGDDYDELELNEFRFVEDEEAEDEIEEGYEYGAEENVFINFEVEGFEADDGEVERSVFVTITDPDGEIYPDLDDTPLQENITSDIDADWGIIEFTEIITYPTEIENETELGWASGENEIELRVVDTIGDKELTITETFVVEE